MKKTFLSLISLACLVMPAFAREALPAATTAQEAGLTAYPLTAYQLTAEYLRAKPKIEAKSAEELAKADSFAEFVEKKGLKAGGRMAGVVAKLVITAVSAAQQQEIEPDPDKTGFQLLLQEALAEALQVTTGKLAGTESKPESMPRSGAQAQAPAGQTAAAGKPATKEEVKETVEKIVNKALEKDAKADFKNIQAYFHTGVTLLNPYRVDTTQTPLSIVPATKTNVNAYLEYVYTNRWAWNEARVSAQFNEGAERLTKFSGFSEGDIQTRVGYTFASGDSPTANTLAGSGNFNAEISAGWPFLISRAPNNQSAFSLGLEVGYGAVTEKAALRAHQNVFAGLGYATSFKDPLGSKDVLGDPRRVLVHVRLGPAKVDSVRYVSSAGSEIHQVNGNLPRYFSENTFGFEAELLYPLKNSTFISFAGKVYPKLEPGLWNLQIGVTTSFTDLLDGFFK